VQTGEFQRLGSTQTRKAHVRIISATNLDLRAAIARGAIDGAPLPLIAGLVFSATLLALGVLPGAALMRFTDRDPDNISPVAQGIEI